MIDPDAIDLILPLEDVKSHLRVDSNAEDEGIQDMIWTAVEHIEGDTGHLFGRRRVTEVFPSFGAIRLRAFPAHALVSLGYLDAAHAPQIIELVDARLVAGQRRPARVVRVTGSWPGTCVSADAVTVEFEAGHEPDEVPKRLRQAALLLIGDLYENRAETSDLTKKAVPMSLTVDRLLKPFRIRAL